ncbi:MFS transporter [Parafrigoribacterium soli]|uniref:MFS transporter n=1 Tax=Parafrigoribacterium soli TaxID=3144663 RepID=UPI0032EE0AB3
MDQLTRSGARRSPNTARIAHRPRPWLMLGIGVAAQASGTFVVTTPALLIPLLHTELGLGLAQAGLLAALPTFGMVLTLVAWGAVTDRFGERWVLSGGLALTALSTVAAAAASVGLRDQPAATMPLLGVCLVLAGMSAASTNAASGRVVIGWFPARRRGLAMGIRQTCQPLGVAVAAVTVPTLAASTGAAAAILVGALLTALCAVACALWIVNPMRTPAPRVAGAAVNPYRASAALLRIHLASALLVVPQFTLSIFGLVWLVAEQHWTPLAAGTLLGLAQFVGALGRIGVGVLSDRLGSRLRPLRWVAASAVVTMAGVGLTGSHAPAALVVAAYLLASCASVADNGLAYTSVAELAGMGWAGRALGAQNTGQFLAASVVGPVMGALITAIGYPLAFLVAAAAPLAALPIVPPMSVEAAEPGGAGLVGAR